MKLYDHQQKIIDADPHKAGLFLGTGSGKTRTALLLARGRVLVIAPKTQYEDMNWQREAQKLFPDGYPGYICVISKEMFRRDHEKLEKFDTVIVDEAHTCLGVTPNTRQRHRQQIPKASQLFEALIEFLKRTNPERVYLCTATIMRSPMTVWGAAQVLGKHNGSIEAFYKFRNTYYFKLNMPGRDAWMVRKDSDLKDRLAETVKNLGFIGRLEDFFDVPEQTFKSDIISLTTEQEATLQHLAIEFPDPLVRLGKRHQVENGVLSGDEFTQDQTFENGKISRILDYAVEFPRMVIFARYSAQIRAIQHALKSEGYATWTLTGATKDRGDVIKTANEHDGILICQAQISAGWELPHTPVMIFASRTHSFVDYQQALGRIQRADHIKKNLYITLIAKSDKKQTVDELQHNSLLNKCDFDERLYLENN